MSSEREQAHGWNVDQILVYIWQYLGDPEGDYAFDKFNSSEMGRKLRLELDALGQRGFEEAKELALKAAQTAPFRAHAADDVDFHSGCEQTRERIVAAIRALEMKWTVIQSGLP